MVKMTTRRVKRESPWKTTHITLECCWSLSPAPPHRRSTFYSSLAPPLACDNPFLRSLPLPFHRRRPTAASPRPANLQPSAPQTAVLPLRSSPAVAPAPPTPRPPTLHQLLLLDATRLQCRIMVGLPSAENREKISRTLLSKDKTEELDFKELAIMTEGYTGSDLKKERKKAMEKKNNAKENNSEDGNEESKEEDKEEPDCCQFRISGTSNE